MKVTKEFEYMKEYLAAKGGKLQGKVVKCRITLTIKEMTHCQAPMVMAFNTTGHQVTIVRVYRGKLFWSYQELGFRKGNRSELVWMNVKADGFSWALHLEGSIYKWVEREDLANIQYPVFASKKEVQQMIRDKAKQFIIVDGVVYQQESEPIYTLESFGICDSMGLSVGQKNYVNYPDFHYSALERELLRENVKQRLSFYREKFDPMGMAYIKVWDKKYVKFKHKEVLPRERRG